MIEENRDKIPLYNEYRSAYIAGLDSWYLHGGLDAHKTRSDIRVGRQPGDDYEERPMNPLIIDNVLNIHERHG